MAGFAVARFAVARLTVAKFAVAMLVVARFVVARFAVAKFVSFAQLAVYGVCGCEFCGVCSLRGLRLRVFGCRDLRIRVLRLRGLRLRVRGLRRFVLRFSVCKGSVTMCLSGCVALRCECGVFSVKLCNV